MSLRIGVSAVPGQARTSPVHSGGQAGNMQLIVWVSNDKRTVRTDENVASAY